MNIGNFSPSSTEAYLLSLIRRNESGDQYNILCGGGHFVGYQYFPQWNGFRRSHAAGAYQFEPGTWQWIMGVLALPDFTPIAQDLAALWLLRQYGPNASISWKASGPYPTLTTLAMLPTLPPWGVFPK